MHINSSIVYRPPNKWENKPKPIIITTHHNWLQVQHSTYHIIKKIIFQFKDYEKGTFHKLQSRAIQLRHKSEEFWMALKYKVISVYFRVARWKLIIGRAFKWPTCTENENVKKVFNELWHIILVKGDHRQQTPSGFPNFILLTSIRKGYFI